MSLTVALNNALTGLNVSQQALSVLSQNISNANTPGYSRQILNQEAVYLGGTDAGVSIQDITRKVDDYLIKAVQLQNSTTGATGVNTDYAARLQLLLGTPGSNNSLDTYISSFFNALQSLAQTPEDTTAQQNVVNTGATLATQTQALANGLQGLQYQADQDIGSAVSAVNTDLTNISQLNTAIVNAKALNNPISGLQDQRDTLLKDLSQYLPITVAQRDSGAISISTGNGVSLLDDNTYQLNYTPVESADAFSNGTMLGPLTVQRFDQGGQPLGQPTVLVSNGVPSQVTSQITNGKLASLVSLRDTQIPNIMSQLDTLTSTLRDQVNQIQNAGTGWPGANSYTGTRLVNAQDNSQWSGQVRIALLDANGQPVNSPYPGATTGVPPLTLDLSQLNTGQGAGNPTTQGIIDAINQYYGVPQNKATVGALDNIQLASDSASLPGIPPQFNFDFDLSNLTGSTAGFYVTNMSVTDSGGASVGAVSGYPTPMALDPANTYTTTAGSNVVTIQTSGVNTLTNGQKVYLTDPGGPIDGIPEASMTGAFTVSNVTANSFQITIAPPATAGTGGTFGVAGMTGTAQYAAVAPGDDTRTTNDGIISADLSGNPASPYYTVTADVAVDDGTGKITTSQITYRVPSQASNTMNTHYAATNVTGGGTLVVPNSNTPLATATLVDANGNEIPKINGQYITGQSGYLKIQAGNSSQVIAIDSMDSTQQGQPSNNPPVAGSGRGFSYYFDLNDFFESNTQTPTGDAVVNSALNLKVEQRFVDNPSLVSTGVLTQSSTPAGALQPVYTYEMNVSDNSVIQKLAQLGSTLTNFAGTGGLGAAKQTYGGYAGQIIGAAATNATNAQSADTSAQTLLAGYTQRADSISGVNLDDELANTVIYQNAYTASARVITVANDLFEVLLNTFQG